MDGFDLSRLLTVPFVALGAASGVAGWLMLAATPPSRDRLARTAERLALAAAAVALTAWIGRFAHTGHLPLFGTYESAWSLALATLAMTVAMRRRLPVGSSPLPWASAVAAALVAHGLSYDTAAYPLTISERSWVVDLHAILAWAAFGAFAVSAAAAFLRLRGSGGADGDGAATFSLSLAFTLHSAMLASGSFYKFLLFGSAWTFDPVETLGFVAWIAYGTLLHLHLLAGWDGRRLARWSLGLFVLLVISYRGIVYFPAWSTYHIFDMDLRMHIVN